MRLHCKKYSTGLKLIKSGFEYIKAHQNNLGINSLKLIILMIKLLKLDTRKFLF